jgi:hypothetical protein
MDPSRLFASINYFVAVVVYAILFILSLRFYFIYRQEDRVWCWYFLGLAIEAFCIVLHTSYWCYAKLVHALGMNELYDKLSAAIPFALAQGFETIGGMVMVTTFIYIFYYAPKE